MNNLGKLLTFMFWVAIAPAFIEIMMYIDEYFFDYELLNSLFIMIIPIVLFIVLNVYNNILIKKKILISKYYAKSILCMYIGVDIMHAYYTYTNDSMGVRISWISSTIFILFIVCFRIVQKIYDKLQNKEMYWWYIILGFVLSVNIGFIVGEYRFLYICINQIVRYLMLLLAIIVINIYKYKRYYKNDIIEKKISKKEYRNNAIKITIISSLLFTVLFSALFKLLLI